MEDSTDSVSQLSVKAMRDCELTILGEAFVARNRAIVNLFDCRCRACYQSA